MGTLKFEVVYNDDVLCSKELNVTWGNPMSIWTQAPKAIETFVDIKENILRYIFRQTKEIKSDSQKTTMDKCGAIVFVLEADSVTVGTLKFEVVYNYNVW